MILARQGPQLCDPTNVGRSTSPDRAGQDDAAGQCAGVGSIPWAAVRLAWAVDARDLPQLERLLYLAAVDLSAANGWPSAPRGSERIRKLVHLALFESANPHAIWAEDGSGKVRRRWSGELRAELVGMQSRAFRARWAKPYEDIYQHLNGWVREALGRIARNGAQEKFSQIT